MWQELNREDTTASFHYLLRVGQILITMKSLDKTSSTVQPLQICRNIEHMYEDHRIFPPVPGSVTKHTLLLHWQRVDALSPLSRNTSTECGSRISWPEDLLLRWLSQESLCIGADLPSPGSLLRVVNAYCYKQEKENSPVLSEFSSTPLEQF